MADQGDSTRYPNLAVKTKLLLATALRLKNRDGALTLANVDRSLPMDLPIDLASNYPAGNEERHTNIMSAIKDSISVGVHDYETLRMAFVELALLYGESALPAHRFASYLALQCACAVTAMQRLVFETPSTIADTVLSGVEELPAALVEDLDEVARRDVASQTQYCAAFGLKSQGKPPVTMQHAVQLLLQPF